VVAGAGAAVAHAIETEILKVQLQQNGEVQINGHASENGEDTERYLAVGRSIDAADSVGPTRLRQLAVASMVLTMIWECRTQLRNLWGLQKAKAKITAKDFTRAPTKQGFVGSEKFLDRVAFIMEALENSDSQLAIVKSFADLIAIDPELKVSADDIDDEMGIAERATGYDTPSDGDSPNPPGSKTGQSRKRRPATANTPNKRQRKSTTPKKGARPIKRSIVSISGGEESDGDWA